MLTYFEKQPDTPHFQAVTDPSKNTSLIQGNTVSKSELRFVAEHFELDYNILQDVFDTDEIPRVEQRDGALYVFVRAARRGQHGKVITTPVLFAAKGGSFINISTADPSQYAIVSPTDVNANLLLDAFQNVLEKYKELIYQTSQRITDTSNRLRTHEVTNADFVHFVTVEDNLTTYSMSLKTMLIVAERLKETFKTGSDIETVEDMALYIRQLLFSIESQSQSVNSIRNAYSTIANNTLNQRMKTLTVFTVLIALPNVVYGMYGMNVKLPLQDFIGAYWIIMPTSILLVLVVFFIGKRLKVF